MTFDMISRFAAQWRSILAATFICISFIKEFAYRDNDPEDAWKRTVDNLHEYLNCPSLTNKPASKRDPQYDMGIDLKTV